ncbi:hypothetical protein CABS01_16569 [Colletotrichum abscissum]|uniref:uncharacterized protein n=1 Tax=Colletotrichum abscissum TaxID=1671311 RepID=UPI0027D50C97|nr:uncharacterized protein CABS01_16569 [Colletotrichum abscissum]KAK1519784.1 hypothetical protein CABS01_16569 [Colletotrichum abscissum]
MRDNRDDDEGYGSSRDTSEQEFPERRHDDVLNKDMLKRRLKHFQLSDTDSNHATVIIGDRFSRLMAGYFKECLDDSGEFELTEYILLQPGATIDIQVAVPDLIRAASSASRARKTLSRMECDEICRVERMMQEMGIENTRHIHAFYPDESGLALEIAQGKLHGWNGLAREETQSSFDILAHFSAWSGVRSASLHTFRGRKPNTNNKRPRDELEADNRPRKRACPL